MDVPRRKSCRRRRSDLRWACQPISSDSARSRGRFSSARPPERGPDGNPAFRSPPSSRGKNLIGWTAAVTMRPICPHEKRARSLGPSRETRARGYRLARNVPRVCCISPPPRLNMGRSCLGRGHPWPVCVSFTPLTRPSKAAKALGCLLPWTMTARVEVHLRLPRPTHTLKEMGKIGSEAGCDGSLRRCRI
jgi:hypothetical protein